MITVTAFEVSNYVARWDAIFHEKCPECQSNNWLLEHGFSACGVEADAKVCEDCDHQWDIG